MASPLRHDSKCAPPLQRGTQRRSCPALRSLLIRTQHYQACLLLLNRILLDATLFSLAFQGRALAPSPSPPYFAHTSFATPPPPLALSLLLPSLSVSLSVGNTGHAPESLMICFHYAGRTEQKERERERVSYYNLH